ncbi:MAG: hypothetical protein IJ658_02800 [Kiritimatiellae bacterium]|nr:hypothetical protein [Kiritimatiellia bacterium]
MKLRFACVAMGLAIGAAVAADTYDRRVQYLESSGTQYIDTGIIPSWNTTFKGDYEYLATVPGSGNYDMIAGVRTTGAGSTRYYPVSLDGSLMKVRYVYSSIQLRKTHLVRTRRSIIFNDENHHVFVDGEDMGEFTAQLSAATRTCWLFGCNSESTSLTKDHWYSAARIYGCEFVTNGVLARKFIPVVDANGEACMFDEVEEKLYRNLGTGTFTAGPDTDGGEVEEAKPYAYLVEYLEATGAQYVDTGLLATSNTQTDVGYQYTEAQAWGAMIGGAQHPSRYYPVSLDNKNALRERYVYGSLAPAVTYPVLQRHEVVFNDENQDVSVDGELLDTFSADFKTSASPMFIFAASSKAGGVADWHSKSRIWHYDVCTNGIPQLNLVPAVDTNGVACFHDLLSGTNLYNKGTGDFMVGRIISEKVALDLSARTDLAEGLNVLPFEVRPSYGTVFALDETTAATYAAEVRADGVYLVAKESAGAAAQVIEVTGNTAIQLKPGEMPTCASIVFSGVVTLTADCDWRGLGTFVVPAGAIIDLHGHDLQVAGITSVLKAETTITDSVGGGRLRVEVAENDILVNDSVSLTGKLKLVKEGAGTFIAALESQSYEGGTEVAAGVMRLAPSPSGYRATVGPETSTITVDAGAVFDNCGVYSCAFNYVLAGGSLMASRASRSNNRQVTSLTLTDDSIVSNKNFGLVGPGYGHVRVRMNGHTLRTEFIRSSGNQFYMYNTTFEGEGRIAIGASWFRVMAHDDTVCEGRNVTLEFPGYNGGLYLDAPFTVSNFINRVSSFKGTGALTVLGTFTPLNDGRTKFPNVVLADGAAIDLSGMEDVTTFNVASQDSTGGHFLSFATNATVKVMLGDRSVPASTPIISWPAEQKPDNLDTLTFVSGDEGKKYALAKQDDGVYVVNGFSIIIR